MAYVEVRKNGKLIVQREVDEQEARKGCRIRIGSAGKIRLRTGQSRKLGKYDVTMYPGQPADDAYKAVEDLQEAASSFPPVSEMPSAGPTVTIGTVPHNTRK